LITGYSFLKLTLTYIWILFPGIHFHKYYFH
jgi:hypothetical protein